MKAGSFSFDPQLRRRLPQENWDQLFSSSYKACQLAIAAEGDKPTIPEPDAEIDVGHGASNSSAELGEVDESLDVVSDVGKEISDDPGNASDRELEIEETFGDEDDDYGHDHNRLIHEDEEWDTDGMGENDDEDDWESIYMDGLPSCL